MWAQKKRAGRACFLGFALFSGTGGCPGCVFLCRGVWAGRAAWVERGARCSLSRPNRRLCLAFRPRLRPSPLAVRVAVCPQGRIGVAMAEASSPIVFFWLVRGVGAKKARWLGVLLGGVCFFRGPGPVNVGAAFFGVGALGAGAKALWIGRGVWVARGGVG